MSFTNPIALFWAILAVPIIVFYLLKVRLRRVSVATTMFWGRGIEEKQPQAIWRHLRNVFSLLLQLLFLFLLVLAIGNPVRTSSLQKQRRIVAVVDNSASMQAIDANGRRRIDVALEQVGTVISSLSDQEEMAIVLTGGRSSAACGLTRHSTTLQETVQQIHATDAPTRLDDALTTARRLLAKHAHGEIVVITDADQPSSMLDDVLWCGVGESSGNVAITEFQTRRSPVDPLAYDLLLEVSNFNDQPVSVTLDLKLDGTLLDVMPLELAAGETRHSVLTKTSMAGGVLKATIAADAEQTEGVDCLATDNVAQAILPAQRRVAVTLVTEGNWFLQHVLQANELIDLTIAEKIPDRVPADSVLVLHRKVPNQIPAGRVFVVDPAASTDLWELAGPLQNPLVDTQQNDSSLLKFVQLDSAVMAEARQLIPEGAHENLVEAISGSPLYVRFARPSGDVLVLTVNLDRGDLPLRTAFPILISNALNWFSGESTQFLPALKTGAAASLSLPMNLAGAERVASRLELVSPTDRTQVLSQSGGAVILPELNQCGIWMLRKLNEEDSGDATESTRIACNIASASESDLRRSLNQGNTGIVMSGFAGPPWWQYLVAMAFVLLVVEWLLFQRRIVG